MATQGAHEVWRRLSKDSDAQRIAQLYSFREITRRVTYSADYTADVRWSTAVHPSSAGEALLAGVSSLSVSPSDLKLALFGMFWFEEPLIDFLKTDLQLVSTVVEQEGLSKRIRWPVAHGRELYDRYRHVFSEGHDTLANENAMKLLDGTGQGVYQCGRVICGPLGLLDSRTSRNFPPQRVFGLWHCPIVNCRGLHQTRFATPQHPLQQAHESLQRAAVRIWDTPSRWEQAIAVWPHPLEEGWKTYSEMPLFLGDCIVGGDRETLLAAAISGDHSDALREALHRKRPKDVTGDARTVAHKLSSDEQLQLLLVISDHDLKRLIDDVVATRKIVIPPTETRQIDAAKLDNFDELRMAATLQLCDLGIRNLRTHPVLLLRRLLLDAYAGDADRSELDWKLRKPENASTDATLVKYLRDAKALAAIDALILTSPRVTKYVADVLETTISMPTETTAKLLAWKLGFNLPREHRQLAKVTRVLLAFAEAVTRTGPEQTDADREAIRSAGVNAFVEFEGLLAEIVAYVIWALTSDHPKETRFVYSRSQATALVPILLGEELDSGDNKIRWQASGNTLGACVRYLQELGEWLKSLPDQARDKLARPVDELGLMLSDTAVVYPFRHRALWADSAPDSLRSLADGFDACIAHLNRADVTGVRNGLEHFRDAGRFPARDKILRSVEEMRVFVVQINKGRFAPKPYWFSRRQTDAYGQISIDVVDSEGVTFRLEMPRTITGDVAVFALDGTPGLIAPGNLIGLPNSEICFIAKEESVYARYWNNYPAAPSVPVESELVHESL